MAGALRLLIIEDMEDHALLLVRELRKGGFDPVFVRVETPQELEAALDAGPWDAIVSDFRLPGFSGLDALRTVQAKGLGIPFILVSGVIGEEMAVESMKAGAHDFILKGNLARLVPALERELREAELRRERKKVDEELTRFREHLEELVLERTAQLEQAKSAAEAANLAKSQFLANMSHELRTPMTGVLGMLDLALTEEISPVMRDYLETASGSARSLVLILNDILDITKLEAGLLTLVEEPFPLRECVAGVIDILIPEARRKGLELTFSVADDVPETVVGDQFRLRQVLTNLCGNAVKFTERGKVEVRVAVGGTIADGMREVAFTVTDTGIGIPDKNKEIIFQKFSQVDPSHTRRFGGTGLGLAISREIAELMDGTISFTSTEGMGSTFTFTVPLGQAGSESDARSAPGAETIEPDPEEGGGRRLLVVDDDPVARKLLVLMLQKSNYETDIAEDGLKGVEMWENGRYDLLLMDVQMPRMDGFEATRAIREKERTRGGHTPIIGITGFALRNDEEKCLAAGMDAFIPKPIDFNKCIEAIRNLIG